MADVTELVTRFTFQGDPGELDHYSSGLRTATVALGAMAAAAAGGMAALNGLVQGAADAILPANRLADTIGVNIERLQELQYVAEQTGSGAEELRDTLSEIAVKAGEAAIDGQSEAFDLMGINVKNAAGEIKSANVLLGEMQGKFREMDGNTRIAVSDIMGLDLSTIHMLSLSADRMAELTEEARAFGVVTKSQANNLAEYEMAVRRSSTALGALRNNVAVSVAPAMTQLSDAFAGFVMDNRERIEGFLTATVNGFMAFLEALNRLKPVLLTATGAVIAFQLASGGMAAAWAAVTGPVGVAVAVIVLAALVIDDLIVALNGGKSVIRDFFLEFAGIDITPILQGMVDGFKKMFGGIMDGFGQVLDGVKDLLGAIVAFIVGDMGAVQDLFISGFSKIFGGILTAWGSTAQGIVDILEAAFPEMIANIKHWFVGLFDWITNKVDAVGSFISGLNPFGDDEPEANSYADSPFKAQAFGLQDGIASVSPAYGWQNNQQIEINVAGGDPQENARAISGRLQDEMRNAEVQASRGGR